MKNSFSHPDHFIAFIHSIFELRNSQKNHWLKTGVFATTSEKGVPSARMVVVRGVNEKLAIEIHTDSRSNKVLDLQKNPQAEILFYDPLTEIQLKCFGVAKIIHTGPLADAAWEKVPESSKKTIHQPTSPWHCDRKYSSSRIPINQPFLHHYPRNARHRIP